MRRTRPNALPIENAASRPLWFCAAADDAPLVSRQEQAIGRFLQHLPQYGEPAGLLDDLTRLLSAELGCVKLGVFLVDDAVRWLVGVRCHPPARLTPPRRLELECPLVGFFRSQPAQILALEGMEPVSNPSEAATAARSQLRELGFDLALPLISRERLIGLLLLARPAADPPYSRREVANLASLTGVTALTLDRLLEEEGLDLVGRISPGLAHDVQDLLTPVSTCMQLEAVEAPGREKARRLLPLAIRNLELVKTRIQHARRLATEARLRFTRQRLDNLLRETVAGLEPELARREITVRLGQLPRIEVEMDDVALLRATTNLLANAVHASPRGAQIEIDLAALCRSANPGAWVEFFIRDHGCGIEPEQLEQILAPAFLNPETGPAGVAPRRGLGLAICREIVALHGGRMDIRSAPGQGTTVTLRLPVQATPAVGASGESL